MAGFNGGIVDAVLRVMAVVALMALNVSYNFFYILIYHWCVPVCPYALRPDRQW